MAYAGPMNRSPRWRLAHPVRDLVAGLLSTMCALAACAPTIELGCKSNDDCAPGRTCAAGQCSGATLADAAGGASGQPDATDPDAQRPSRDAAVPDAAVPDAGVGPCPLDPGAPVPMEQCNGLDDDCDGVADEGAQGLPVTEACIAGPPETAGVGVCVFGARICHDGSLGPCVGAVPPGQEICDGADNDCNGVPDDVEGGCAPCEPQATRPCYTGSPETLGVGDCQSGTQVCGEDGWGPCEGETRPESEACDEHDNDCNGEIDDQVAGIGEDCTVGLGTCAGDGTQICDAGIFRCDALQLTPVEERCNALDDDCDGQTDEDFSLGRACSVGVGACQMDGGTVCADDERSAICDAVAGAPRDEDCNGLDDDCDGETDEPEPGADVLIRSCYDGADGTRGVGPCAAGRQWCMSPIWGACVDQTLPWPEICDGVDNDCDGVVDDGLGNACSCRPGQEQSCYGGPPGTEGVGACHAGTQTCDAGRFGQCVGESLPTAETCNVLDDDCNGDIDDVAGLGEACTAGVGACRYSGHTVCSDILGALTCDASPGAAGVESCNGIDDDCDGSTDEDFDLGAACFAGVGLCQRPGVQVCDAVGGVRCGVEPGMAVREACDGLDNDCDSVVDNGAEAACVPLFGAVPRCEGGGCRYSCGPRAFDVDANPNDGCEHVCAGATTGDVVDNLRDPNGRVQQAGDFAIVTEPGGTAGIAYLKPTMSTSPALMLSANGVTTAMSRGLTGAYEAPALAHIAGRWITFANHSTGANLVASDFRFDGAVATPPDAITNQWDRLGSSIPGAAAYGAGEQRTGVAYVVEPLALAPGPYVGHLRTRVMNALTGMPLDDDIIGQEADYVSHDARLLGFTLGGGTAVVAQTALAQGYGLRFVMVSPQGNITGSAMSPISFPNATRDFAGALTNNGGTFALVDADTGHLLYWRLTFGANNMPALTGYDTQINGVSSVSVVYGQGGPMLFVLQNNALRVLFLDSTHSLNGSLADVVLPPTPADTLLRAHVSSNGNRIHAAWTVRVGEDIELRTAQLGCQ
jgi:hypothetical protein